MAKYPIEKCAHANGFYVYDVQKGEMLSIYTKKQPKLAPGTQKRSKASWEKVKKDCSPWKNDPTW